MKTWYRLFVTLSLFCATLAAPMAANAQGADGGQVAIAGLSPAAERIWRACMDPSSRLIRAQANFEHVSIDQSIGEFRPAFEAASTADSQALAQMLQFGKQTAVASHWPVVEEFFTCLVNARMAALNGAATAPAPVAAADKGVTDIPVGYGTLRTAADRQPGDSTAPISKPVLIVQENYGTRCLEAHLEDIHLSDPPDAINDMTRWLYTIVLENRCDRSVVWYTETYTGPAPIGASDASRPDPFIYAGYGWPLWNSKFAPAWADYQPMEVDGDVPLAAGARKTASQSQPYRETQPVQIWITSCDAYDLEQKRAVTMFNTGAPLSRDGRFFCVANVPPTVHY
ncbi:MAG: hypothetical protein JWP35_629 [Caulobacter sp.]|nr:hypothetical protein [Caulobacter sp.]